jgi:hypothetical protein
MKKDGCMKGLERYSFTKKIKLIFFAIDITSEHVLQILKLAPANGIFKPAGLMV